MRVYIAGPLTKGDQYVNARTAILAGDRVQAAGHDVFIPHLSVAWQMISPHDYEWWMRWCLAWLSQCQALIRIPGESSGGDREVAEARRLGIPVFESVDEFLHSALPLDGAIARQQAHCKKIEAAVKLFERHDGAMMTKTGDEYVVTWR